MSRCNDPCGEPCTKHCPLQRERFCNECSPSFKKDMEQRHLQDEMDRIEKMDPGKRRIIYDT